MGWIGGFLPMLWAQATGPAPVSTTTNPSSLVALALRRWCASQTLSSPESVPTLFGLWTWLGGLGGLFALVLCFQGVGRALGQLVDVPGHARWISAATGRLRRASRMLAVTVGLTVVSWTVSQSFVYNKAEGRDDLVQLTRARHLVEVAVEQGVLAALTPLRDVASLGSNLPLLLVAIVLLFRASAEVWGTGAVPPWVMGELPRASGWTNLGWGCGSLLILYRLLSLGAGTTELPLGVWPLGEALLLPPLMALCDGLLLAWILSELRAAGFDKPGADSLDTRAATDLMPASILACLMALPARYLATLVLLASSYLPASAGTTAAGRYVRWQLSYGLADVQGLALLTAGLAGAVAWSSGGIGESCRGYARLLASQGARLVVMLALAGLAAGALSAVAYAVVLALPAAPWVLNAADSYAHYATLPVGLWTLSALVELGERSLPEAELAATERV